jgi:hypothetical protein
MDYFSHLPPDVFRETALKLSSKDVFELSFDPKFNSILDNNFWKRKLEIDSEYFKYFLGLKPVLQEPYYNIYLYSYFRFLQYSLSDHLEKISDEIGLLSRLYTPHLKL